jgi:serine/threonine protein kinase
MATDQGLRIQTDDHLFEYEEEEEQIVVKMTAPSSSANIVIINNTIVEKTIFFDSLFNREIETISFIHEGTSMTSFEKSLFINVTHYSQKANTISIPYYSHGDLYGHLEQNIRRYYRNMEACMPVFKRMIQIVYILHKHGILYGDVKLENFLMTSDENNEFIACDFGSSFRNMKINSIEYIKIGTPKYSAPELIDLDAAGFFTDVYALGICMMMFLIGGNPEPDLFKGPEALNEIRRYVAYFNEDIQSFFIHILHPTVYKRMTMEELINHSFIGFSDEEKEIMRQ